MFYVYELVDAEGQVVYVGESKNPKDRFKSHIKKKPKPGIGKFYGRTDLTLKITSAHNTRKKAMEMEGQRKLSLGLEWSERASGPKEACPHCGNEYYAKGLTLHIHYKHK